MITDDGELMLQVNAFKDCWSLPMIHGYRWLKGMTCPGCKFLNPMSSYSLPFREWPRHRVVHEGFNLIWRFLPRTLMMERFTDRWIQHYFSYHKCPPVRTFRLQTLWAVDTSLQECHGLFFVLLLWRCRSTWKTWAICQPRTLITEKIWLLISLSLESCWFIISFLAAISRFLILCLLR